MSQVDERGCIGGTDSDFGRRRSRGGSETKVMPAGSRPGVLLLAPDATDPHWQMLEVDSEVMDSVHLPPDAPEQTINVTGYNSALAALDAAYDTLTIIAEGRIPAMHEHVQESVREFVQVLEGRGYDRETALRLLLDMVDRMSDRSPVQPKRATREGRRAS